MSNALAILSEAMAQPAWAPVSQASLAAGIYGPRPHQIEDVTRLADLLRDECTRTTYVAACGSGKTLTALWVTQALGARRVIIGFPSLALVSQTMQRWDQAHDPALRLTMRALASAGWDPTRRPSADAAPRRADAPEATDPDAAEPEIRDMPLEACYGQAATTDVDDIERFWSAPLAPQECRCLFVCYKSADKLVALFRRAADNAGLQAPDLLICDEAHHLAGTADKDATVMLDEALVPADRRLYQTATPILTPVDQDETEADRARLRGGAPRAPRFYGMDLTTIWGKTEVVRGFRWAIDHQVLTDYKLVTPPPLGALQAAVDQQEAAEVAWRARHPGRERLPAGYWAKAFLVARELLSVGGTQQMFAFHNRTKDARHFAAAVRIAAAVLSGGRRGTLFVAALTGDDALAQREQRLAQFRAGRPGLITSVNILTEGVDAPSVDGIAFIDKRTSVVSMAQGVGRALRLDPTRPHKIARIFVPMTHGAPAPILAPVVPASGTLSAADADRATRTAIRAAARRSAQAAAAQHDDRQLLLEVLEVLGETDDLLSAHAKALRIARAARQPISPALEQFFKDHLEMAHVAQASTADRVAVREALEARLIQGQACTFADHYHACVAFAATTGSVVCTVDTMHQGLPIGRFLSSWRLHIRDEDGGLSRDIGGRTLTPKQLQRRKQQDDQRRLIETLPGWTLAPEDKLWQQTALELTTWMLTHRRAPNHLAAERVERRLGMWAKNTRAGESANSGANEQRTPLTPRRRRFLQRVCPMFTFTETPAEATARRAEAALVKRLAQARKIFERRTAAGEPLPPELYADLAELSRREKEARAQKKQRAQQPPAPQPTAADLAKFAQMATTLERWVATARTRPRKDVGLREETDLGKWLCYEEDRLSAAPDARIMPFTQEQRVVLATILSDLEFWEEQRTPAPAAPAAPSARATVPAVPGAAPSTTPSLGAPSPAAEPRLRAMI